MMRGALARAPVRAWARRVRYLAAAAALAAGVLAAGAPAATAGRAAALASLGTTSITVNGSGGDQTFMGIGAVLGGGGNARYLMDYPQQQRGDILNYLFKPGYGASLQILKLEIGGGANSTDGSEPSIEPVPSSPANPPNCNAGYEFAIAKQAVTINPDIKLYGLQWSAPGWVSAGVSPASVFTGSYSATNGPSGDIKYLIDWLNCAKQWGLTISYLGGWNESSGANGHSGNYSWYSNLRAALDAVGYRNVQLIAGDLNPTWEYASSASPNPFPAISILGTHDICGYPTEHEPTDVCDPPEVVTTGTDTGQPINTLQPLWASELGAMDGTTLSNCAQSPQFTQQPCADAMDRALVRGYYETRLDGNNRGDPGLTGYLEWPALDAMPAAGVGGCIDEATGVLPHEDQGLITADQPWQGHYCVNAMTWAIAHFTQFVSPPDAANPGGWQYEDSSTGYLLGSSADGSYVTFIKSGRTDWTTVIEATKASADQTVNFTVTGGARGLATKPVHVWSSDFSQGSPASSHFMGPTTIQPNNSGQFQLTVQPGYVYTLTTTTGQSKGNAGTAPAAANFPLPYPPGNICPLSSPPNDSLACSGNAGSNDDEPSYLAAQDGSFELKPCLSPPPDGSATCTEQKTAPIPVLWPYDQDVTTVQPRYPYAIIGDTWMTDYTVSSDVLLTQNNTSAGLIARFGSRASDSEKANTSVGMFAGYVFDVTTAGVWKLFKNTPTGQSTVQQGTIAALGTGTWQHLALQVSQSTITAWVDGTQIVSWTDPSNSPYLSGLAGIEAGAFGNTWPDVQYSNLKITSP